MGSSKSTNQQTSTSSIDPRYSDAAWSNYGNTQNAMQNWNPTSIPTPLGFNQQQLGAQNMVTNLATQDPNGGYTGQAGQLFTNAGGYKPLNIAAMGITSPTIGPGANVGSGSVTGQGYTAAQGTASQVNRNDIRNISGGTIDPAQMNATDLAKYEAMIDPSYTNGVVNSFLADNQRANQMALQPDATAAAQAGAFGGTRQAVLEGQTNDAYARTAANTTSQLRLNQYNEGLSNYQADLGRKQQGEVQNASNALTAAQANQGVDSNTANTNANLGQQMSMTNLNAENSAGQFSANAANQAALETAQMGMQASTTNAQMANARALAQAQMEMQAGMANSQNNLTAQQDNQAAGFNAANLGMTAGSNLAALGQTVRGNTLDNANILGQVGQQNYNLSAAQQQAAYQNQLNQNNAPLMRSQFLQGALASVPYGTTTTGNSTTTQTPSLLSQIFGIAGTGAQMFAASDVRLKHNVKPMGQMVDGLKAVRKLKPVTYNWNHSGVPDLGFTAQNVESVMPSAVREFGGVKHINLPGVIGLLAHSIKQLDRKVSKAARG